jgi:hypothetical protein
MGPGVVSLCPTLKCLCIQCAIHNTLRFSLLTCQVVWAKAFKASWKLILRALTNTAITQLAHAILWPEWTIAPQPHLQLKPHSLSLKPQQHISLLQQHEKNNEHTVASNPRTESSSQKYLKNNNNPNSLPWIRHRFQFLNRWREDKCLAMQRGGSTETYQSTSFVQGITYRTHPHTHVVHWNISRKER